MLEKFDFFISFSNQDEQYVSQVVEKLENIYGAKCWYQLKDSKAEFINAIMNGIENSDTFVLFISPSSANSYFVLNEVNHAIECKQKNPKFKIVPVLLNSDEKDIMDDTYKAMRFYLGRLNIILTKKDDSLEWLIAKIFEQCDYKIEEDLKASLYRSSDIEEERIKSQSEILDGFTKEFWVSTVKEDFNILDIGCSNGSNIKLHLKELKYNTLLGVDIDATQIENANKNANKNDKFICFDVMDERFDDYLDEYLDEIDQKGFDLIHISEVLLHLQDPISLLKRLRRYLKRNGFLFIQDDDDGLNVTYPESNFFKLATDIWYDSKESGDRKCGRKIPIYLKKAGYSNVSLKRCGISNVDLPADKQNAFWDIYFNYYLWEALSSPEMFNNFNSTSKLIESYKSMYESEKEKYDNGEYFIQLGFVFYVAVR